MVARKSEEFGFDSLWLGEHPIMPVQSASRLVPRGVVPHYRWFVDPFVALARASAVTTRLKLGTGFTLVPERNPLLLAKESPAGLYSGLARSLFIGTGWH